MIHHKAQPEIQIRQKASLCCVEDQTRPGKIGFLCYRFAATRFNMTLQGNGWLACLHKIRCTAGRYLDTQNPIFMYIHIDMQEYGYLCIIGNIPRFLDIQIYYILDIYEAGCTTSVCQSLEDTLPPLSPRFRRNLQQRELQVIHVSTLCNMKRITTLRCTRLRLESALTSTVRIRKSKGHQICRIPTD